MKKLISFLFFSCCIFIVNAQIALPSFQGFNSAKPSPFLVFSSDGSSLTGWTFGGATIDLNNGNPTSCFKITAANQQFYRDLGQTFHNKTILFDYKPGTSSDMGFLFAQNSGGNSVYRVSLRMWQDNVNVKPQGLGSVDNGGWLYLGGPSYYPVPETTAIFTTANIWYKIKIRITSDRVCTWYINGVQQLSTFTINVGYTKANTTQCFFGFLGNNYGGTAYFDNLEIWNGIK